jgi:hypothetical protein
MWLAVGVCLGGERTENPRGSDPAAQPGDCMASALGDASEVFDFDSGPRPFDMIFAQGPGQGSGGGFGGRHGQEWNNRRKHLEQLRILKMLETLNLAEDQELEFLIAFRAVRKEHGRLNVEKETLIDSLSGILDGDKIEGDAVNTVVDRILAIEDAKREVMADFVKTTRALLTPEQLGRFVVFHERFERQLLEQVKSFRDRRKGPFPEPPVGEG